MQNIEIKRKFFRFVFVFVLLAWVGYILFFSNYGFVRKWQLEKERKELLNQIREEIRRRDSLEQRIKLLETDTLEIERIAREIYGLVKEGEEIYAITKKKAN